jgi:hypothetical protein
MPPSPAPAVVLGSLSDELWERVARLLRPADLIAFAASCRPARRAFLAVVRARSAPFHGLEPILDGALVCENRTLDSYSTPDPPVCARSPDGDHTSLSLALSSNFSSSLSTTVDPVSASAASSMSSASSSASFSSSSPFAVSSLAAPSPCSETFPPAASAPSELLPALTLPDSPQWVGYYSQATLSPRNGHYLVRVHVRCCERCNPHVDFSVGADIGAGAELWDTCTGERVHFIHFNVKYPGKKRVDLRWVDRDTLCVIVGDSCRENDAPQVYTFAITRDASLQLISRLYVTFDLPTVDLFDPTMHDLADVLSNPLPRVIRVQTDVYAVSEADCRSFSTRSAPVGEACPAVGPGAASTSPAVPSVAPGAARSSAKLLVVEPACLSGSHREPLCVQTSMDGQVLLLSDRSLDYARTFALNTLPDTAGPVEGTSPAHTCPLASIPARAGCSRCFLSPCGAYVAVLTSKFRSEDLQNGFTEDLSVTMYRSHLSTPMYSHTLALPVRGDFRPGKKRSRVGTRANCADAFFNDASSSTSDTFGIPMNDEGLPILFAVETGTLICVPDLAEQPCDRPGRSDASHYQFSLNEDMLLTFFSTQYGIDHGTIHVYDAIAPLGQKLIASFDTPTIHRWRCEAHISGFILVENNCMCCSSYVYLPSFKSAPNRLGSPNLWPGLDNLTMV